MDPTTMLAVGSAIAGGLSSIFGGQAASAEQQRRNQEAFRNWINSNSQKTFNNAREHFQASYNFQQQLKRNNSIAQSAYRYQTEAKQVAATNFTNQRRDMARLLSSNSSTLLNAITARGVSSTSGMYGALATMQALDALEKSSQVKQAYEQELKGIDRQFRDILSQQTENIYAPNIQLPDSEPIYGDSSAAATGGLISGVLQIGSGLAAGFMPTKKTTTTTTSGATP